MLTRLCVLKHRMSLFKLIRILKVMLKANVKLIRGMQVVCLTGQGSLHIVVVVLLEVHL